MSALSKMNRCAMGESIPKRPRTNALKHSASVDRGPNTPAVSFQEKMPAPTGFSRKFSTIPADQKPLMDAMTFPASYKVKEEFTQTAQSIFRKHGDIAVDCLFEATFRMVVLQSAWTIYEKLKKLTFSFVTLDELELLQTDVNDLEKAQLKVSWLAERIDEIYTAKLYVERSSLLDEEREKNQQCIETLEKELNLQQQELPAIRINLELEKEKTATILQTFLKAKEKAMHFSWKSPKDGSCSSLNISTLAGYKVKKEFESAAQVIFSNQGDIVANCLFEGSFRCNLLEFACAIYQKMEKLSTKDITLAELEVFRTGVHDLEKAEVDVSWVAKGLDDMYQTKKSVESSSFMKAIRHRNNKILLEIENEIILAEGRIREVNEKLKAEKARHRNILNAKENASRFFRKSLVDGI